MPSLGVFIGFLVHAETAFPVVTALMFALGYFGGLFVPVTSMPHALQLVAHTLPSFHNTALGVALLAGQRLDVAHWLVLLGYGAVLGLLLLVLYRREESRGIA